MSMMPRSIACAATMLLLASAADAGDQGGPEKSCDGNTFEMVECLKARTAQWDQRMTTAFQQALKDAVPQQREQLRAAQRYGYSIATPTACITAWARARSRGSMPVNACAA